MIIASNIGYRRVENKTLPYIDGLTLHRRDKNNYNDFCVAFLLLVYNHLV